ncbi:MAG: hypothetical protein GEU91_06845 [Rhizobiales bacterium]|nr:hypothetical protein [Hyphomicrobiales bacterium]
MKALAERVAELGSVEICGRVIGVRGLMVEVAGPDRRAGGDRKRRGAEHSCEVVGTPEPAKMTNAHGTR